MPSAGGRSTVTGIDFEAWFVALKFTDAFFNDELRVRPQAQTYIDPGTQRIELTSIDDLHISYQPSIKKDEFYNLKFRAPNIKSWRVSELRNQKVLLQLKEQFVKSPHATLYFVTQSPCPVFQEILPSGKNCSSREELEINLKRNNYIDQWDSLKSELGFSDEEMIAFAGQVGYKHIIDIKEIENLIWQKLEHHVTDASSAPNWLYHLAIEAAKDGRVVSRNEVVSYLENNNIHLKAHLRSEELLEKIYLASGCLESVPDTFFDDCHIDREEVGNLLSWVKTPLADNKPPIAVLIGKAGCGKSVILKDLLKRLRKENIAVLGIKTDLLMIDSIPSLSQELGLPDGIKETLATIVERYGVAVILFDQMDALSQTLSTDRKIINTYINLISQLSLIRNLMIIISCRTFDLKYDPLLQRLEDKYTVEVKNLSEEQVGLVLSRLGIEKGRVSKTLMQLLEIPLHLRAFSNIYKEGINLASLNTLQDLYEELWNHRILSAMDKQSVLDAVETITETMDRSKSLNIPFALLDRNDEGRRYLLSQSILIKQERKLQFFHQSFFDFCYARTFMSLHDSLINAVIQQHQGLFVRSQIKQVLSYLRGSDFPGYLTELEEFLNNKKVRFHIWLLVLNQLAFVEDPTDEEWQVIKPLLDTSPDFLRHFVEALRSEQWLRYLISHRYLQALLESSDNKLVSLVVWKLVSLVNIFTDTVVDFLYAFPEVEKKDEYICRILGRLDHWENERSVKLFEDKLDKLKNSPDDYQYDLILERVFKHKPEIICKVFFDSLNKKLDNILSPDDFENRDFCSYHDIELLKKIWSWNEEIAFSEGFKIIHKLVEKTKYVSDRNFYRDKAFSYFDRSESDIYKHWVFFVILEKKWKSIAQNDKSTFLKLATDLQCSNSLTLLKLLVRGHLTNPESYVKEGFRLLIRQGILEEIASSESEGYELRCLLNNIYPFFSPEQKEMINKLILSAVIPAWEKGRCKGRRSWAGYSKYMFLCAIPKDELKSFPNMKRQFYELERIFGKYEDHPPKGIGLVEIGPPLPKKAYESMTLGQWVSSFKRYDGFTSTARRKSPTG